MKLLETEVVIDFNEAINRRDLDDLVALMTEDHRFVDPGGSTVAGRDACRVAQVVEWRVADPADDPRS